LDKPAPLVSLAWDQNT